MKDKIKSADAQIGKLYFVNCVTPPVKLLRFTDIHAVFEHGIVLPKNHKVHVIGHMTLIQQHPTLKGVYIRQDIINGELIEQPTQQ